MTEETQTNSSISRLRIKYSRCCHLSVLFDRSYLSSLILPCKSAIYFLFFFPLTVSIATREYTGSHPTTLIEKKKIISKSNSKLTMEKYYYMVQRSYHSGPNEYPPLDYLRVFESQREAEEAAYHSAHAWSRYKTGATEGTVRTILLPSYPASEDCQTSYGFVAHGSLFWVRGLFAHCAASNGVCISQPKECHAVISAGVVGGTANANAHRTTGFQPGRLFYGDDSARFAALHVCQRVMKSLPPGISATVVTLPVGPPSGDAYSSGKFLKDWPPQVLNPALMNVPTSPGTSSYHINNKRGSIHSSDHAATSSPISVAATGSPRGCMSSQQPTDFVVDCPFEPPPQAKRRRRCFGSAPTVSYEELDATTGNIGTIISSGSMDDDDRSSENYIWQMRPSAAGQAHPPPAVVQHQGPFSPHPVAISEDEMQMA